MDLSIPSSFSAITRFSTSIRDKAYPPLLHLHQRQVSHSPSLCPYIRPCVRSVGLLMRLTMTVAEPRNLADVRVVHREVPTLCCSDARMRRTETLLPGETEIQVHFQVCVRFWGPSKSGVFTDSRVRPTGVGIDRGMGKTDLGAP